MKGLRNIFGLLKRHYEKVILALALLGLIGAVWYLNEMKSEENSKIELYDKENAKRKPREPSADANFVAAQVQAIGKCDADSQKMNSSQ